jgi:Domain of unknown function (DUF4340)
MRGFRSTLALLFVFLGLLGYLYYESKKPAAPPADQKPKAFAVQADAIEELSVKGTSGEVTRLEKGSEGWEIVEPAATRGAETEVTSITQGLASLDVQRVVDENPSDLSQFGLAEPKIDVGFRASGQSALTHLLVGDKTPTGGELYAKIQDQNRVFLISSYLDGTFNRTPFDLRDKAILKFDREHVSGVEIGRPKEPIALAKEGAEWNLTRPVRAMGDFGTVEGLLGQIEGAQMVAVAAPEAKDLRPYGLDKPGLTLTVVEGADRKTLEVGKKAPDGASYARESGRPVVFTISQALVTELDKPAAEYRKKDIFDFRPFNTTRLELTRDNQTVVFEKTSADEQTPARWQLTTPTKKDIDSAKFESSITQLSALKADSFVDASAPTGLRSPIAAIVAKFDDGKREERVAFGKSGSNVYAARGTESGAARIDAVAFASAMDAFNEFK